eukprot:gene33872-41784_t
MVSKSSANRSLKVNETDESSRTPPLINFNQSIIVSGESGAGKTEASKHTVRNDNSSRFGKYIKLQYSSIDNTLKSAVTETFLLEKSRLVSVNQDERNYHIFYQLLRGLKSTDPQLFSALCLERSIEEFNILTAGNCTIITSAEDDSLEFTHTHRALQTIHCSSEEIQLRDDVEFTTCTSPSIDMTALATLLGVHSDQLVACLSTQQMRIAKRSSIKVKVLSLEETRNNAQALMKYIYSKLFAWLVAKINLSHSSNTNSITESTNSNNKFIGILDIFGFEILQNNSFEQLCINFTNERLQQQFNEHVFVTEQEIYRSEGLNWSSITFQDNQHVIDMIARKPTGLLFILEEHGMMNRKPDDTALLTGFNAIHASTDKQSTTTNTNSSAYVKSRFGNTLFVVKHFA